MSKRSNIEIFSDILRASMTGARKSHIVYQANLNFKIVKKYLDLLGRSGLINGPSNEGRVFYTTEKGLEYLQHLEGLTKFMNESEICG